MRIFSFSIIIIITIILGVQSHPQNFNCDGTTWVPNAEFGHMLVEKFSEDSKECWIEGVPDRIKSGKRYQLKVRSKQLMAHKLVVSKGMLRPDKVRTVISIL